MSEGQRYPRRVQDRLDRLDSLIDAGITASLNEYGAAHGLPPLMWQLSQDADVTLEGTHPLGRAAYGAAELCESWAIAGWAIQGQIFVTLPSVPS